MLKIVSNASKLQNYQNQFMEQLELARTDTIEHCRISWRPESIDAEVNWSSKVNLWWYSRLVPENKLQQSKQNRWWNVFGISHPKPYQELQINCEINIPTNGINRNVAGAFAEDENSRVFVIHRGNRWGGGKKGVTKALFWTNYSGHSEIAHDGERTTRVAVIAELGDNRLPSNVANFVHWVAEVKGSI